MAVARVIHRLSISSAGSSLARLAKRANLKKECLIIERNGVPVAGILDAEELEDYLEMRNPRVRGLIAASNRDIRAAKTRPASKLLAELKRQRKRRQASIRTRRP